MTLRAPRLSTMVVLHSLPMKLNTNQLVEQIPLNDVVIKVEKKGYMRRGESKRDRIQRRNPQVKTTSGFGHNSITLVMMVNGFGRHVQKEVTIKIFHNGVFHLTGLPHEDYERHAIDEMMKIMRALPEQCFLEKPVEWIDPIRRVVLMNFTTSFSDVDKLSRIAVQTFFKEKGYRADFEPDVDPAVKVQFAEGWIARIFRTGKINLTALKTTDDCVEFVRRLDVLFSDFFITCVS